MRHLATRIAEESKTKIQKRDQHQKRNEDKQRQRLMPRKYGEREEDAKYDARSDRDAPVPKPFLVY